MKKWNTPSVEELNVKETANGILDTEIEFWWMTNDNNKKSSTPDNNDENNDQVNQLS